jgi:ferredoxin-NADP reductase
MLPYPLIAAVTLLLTANGVSAQTLTSESFAPSPKATPSEAERVIVAGSRSAATISLVRTRRARLLNSQVSFTMRLAALFTSS